MNAPTNFNRAAICRVSISALAAFLMCSGSVQAQQPEAQALQVQQPPVQVVRAQSTQQTQNPPPFQAQPSTGNTTESLLLGPGDTVHVTVFQSPELDTHARITDTGEITVPLAGTVHVSNMTPAAAGLVVAQKYSAGGFLRQPQVTVMVDDYATQSVAIMGEVMRPGNYPIATPRNVIDVLALAGGLDPQADRHITIQHRFENNSNANAVREQVFLPNDANAALSAQVLVRPGDLIIVPKAGIVYILGDVGRPGGYVMQDDSTLTVLQAVALAAGANRTAAEANVRLIRRSGAQFTEIAVPLKQIQKGEKADIALQHDDVLWVPFSYRRNFMVSAPAIMGSTSSAAIYRNY
jgi:polysaccharide biosynthesis/export protein